MGIGHLQSNKAKVLAGLGHSIACIETVDSEKLAKTLNKAWQAANLGKRLNVMVQVNTSGEGTKNGVHPKDCTELCSFIANQCSALQLAGLMTIGAPDYSGCRSEDFEMLRSCRAEAAAAIGVELWRLELSMGMSNDYENAIREGSTSVRVG